MKLVKLDDIYARNENGVIRFAYKERNSLIFIDHKEKIDGFGEDDEFYQTGNKEPYAQKLLVGYSSYNPSREKHLLPNYDVYLNNNLEMNSNCRESIRKCFIDEDNYYDLYTEVSVYQLECIEKKINAIESKFQNATPEI